MNEIRARIVSQEKGLYKIASEKGELLSEVSGKFRYETEKVSDFPAVGDYVISTWPEDGSRGIISMIFPRRSCFIRKAAGKDNQEQVVAANIDYVFLCMSLNRDFNLRRLERYLAIAWDSDAEPIILLTKKDLCEDLEKYLSEVSEIARGARVLPISSMDESAQMLLDEMEEGKTYALIGSSGVGKSTLINRLTGEDAILTGGLRNDDKGHHTTTHRELIALKNGAFVIDTPGMRELGMWDSGEGIDTVFSDIEELMEQCRFSNCSHTSEVGCMVQEAISDGRIARERWEAYLKLKKENAYTEGQGEYLKAKKEKFKAIARINKGNKKK